MKKFRIVGVDSHLASSGSNQGNTIFRISLLDENYTSIPMPNKPGSYLQRGHVTLEGQPEMTDMQKRRQLLVQNGSPCSLIVNDALVAKAFKNGEYIYVDNPSVVTKAGKEPGSIYSNVYGDIVLTAQQAARMCQAAIAEVRSAPAAQATTQTVNMQEAGVKITDENF